MLSITIVSFCIFLANSWCYANESCLINDGSNCTNNEINKYAKEINKKYDKYLNLINQAKAIYKPCNLTKCKCFLPIIKNDLKIFKNKVITKEAIENVISKGTKYQIIHNRLYRDKNCMFPARCAGIEHFIIELLPKLSDMEFIINTRDWPQIHKRFNSNGPIFSFSKTDDYNDIMYPAWAFWEGGPAISLYPKGLGRWDKHRQKLGKIGNETAWETKVPKGFFRGSRTSSERDTLVLFSREKPELVDAKYTKNQAWKSEADTLHAPPVSEVSLEDHCKYKYLFNFRGVAASFRFKHILLCKSLVFHVGNEWLEFFYPILKPWVHYIPISSNFNKKQLEELLEFVLNHDDIVKEIAENGYNIIWNHLKLKNISCYWKKLLTKYARLLNYSPILDNNLIEIK